MKITISFFAVVLIIFMGGCFALRDDVDILRSDLRSIDDRVKKTEEKLFKINLSEFKKEFEKTNSTIMSKYAEMGTDIDKLYEEIASIRGEIDKPLQANENSDKQFVELKNVKKQLDELTARFSALELRVDSGEGTGEQPKDSPAFESSAATTDTVATDTKEAGLYEEAYSDYLNGDYQNSREKFSKFLKDNPAGENSANSQFWIGECYYASKEYDDAINEFGRLLKNFSDSPKVPTAYLKIGYSFSAKGDVDAARNAFQVVIDKFPASEEAKTATDELKKLRSEKKQVIQPAS